MCVLFYKGPLFFDGVSTPTRVFFFCTRKRYRTACCRNHTHRHSSMYCYSGSSTSMATTSKLSALLVGAAFAFTAASAAFVPSSATSSAHLSLIRDGKFFHRRNPARYASQHADTYYPFPPNGEESKELSRILPADKIAGSGLQSELKNVMSDIWKARLLVILAAALYGTNFTCVKVLEESVAPGASTTLRFALASLATLPWLLTSPKQEQLSDLQVGINSSGTENITSSLPPQPHLSTATLAALSGFEVGIYNSLGYISQAVGLETTDASKSAFVCSLAVVVVPILDFLSGKRILPREVFGAAMAVAGVAFLELADADAAASISRGDLITLIQPLAFGLGFWRMEAGMHQYPDEAKRMTAAQILAVFLGSSVYTIFLSGEHTTTAQILDWLSNPHILSALFWTGCITTALTVYMETVALKSLSAAEATMIFSTEPLWGTAFASVVVGEHLGIGAGVGAALILGGCLFSNMGRACPLIFERNLGRESESSS